MGIFAKQNLSVTAARQENKTRKHSQASLAWGKAWQPANPQWLTLKREHVLGQKSDCIAAHLFNVFSADQEQRPVTPPPIFFSFNNNLGTCTL